MPLRPSASWAFLAMDESALRSCPTLMTSCATMTVMLGVDGSLDVVADDACPSAAGGHRAGVWVSQRQLLVRLLLKFLLHLAQRTHVSAQLGYLVLELRRLGRQAFGLGAVGCVQRLQVAVDAFLDLLHALFELVRREVAVAVVDRLELAAVNRHDAVGKQLELAADHDELAADVADAGTVVAAEVGDGLEVRRQASGQPHQLDVALALPLQAPTALHAVDVTVDVDAQQHGRVIRGGGRSRQA